MKKYSLAGTMGRIANLLEDGEVIVAFSIRESWSFIDPLTVYEVKKYRPDWCRYDDEALILLPPQYKIRKKPSNLKEARELGELLLHYLPVEDDLSIAGYVYLVYSRVATTRKEIVIEAYMDGSCDNIYWVYEIYKFADGSRIILKGERSKGHCGWETMGEKRMRLREIIGDEPVEIEEYVDDE